MKKFIDVFDYAGRICKAMPQGILLTTGSGEKVNTMTIGWGTLGIEWGKRIFVAYVRESRFTRELLDQTGEFTVNIPAEAPDRSVIRYCGSKSGRDTDKIRDMGLTLEQPEKISVPGIREFPITLECRVMYKQLQDAKKLPPNTAELYYPVEDGKVDNHFAYYAEIVSAYVITE